MPLPSSGSISMSQINSEAGFSSSASDSSTVQRTFDYAFSGVDQNTPYSFSEFYSKTYSAAPNSVTFYYYYPFDGGNGYNNPQVWGWKQSSSAEAHVGLYQTWTHTAYYTGTLSNGTKLYISAGYSGGTYGILADEGYYDEYPYYGTPAWYYLTDGSNEWVCTASSNSPTFTVANLTLLAFTISWYYYMSSQGGSYEITKNGSTVASASSTNGGTFNVVGTDYVSVFIQTYASYPLNAEASLYIYDNGTVLYSNNVVNYGFASDSYGPYYPTGSGYANGDSVEF